MAEAIDPKAAPPGEIIDRWREAFEADWLAGRPERIEDVVPSAPATIRFELFRKLLSLECEYRARDGRPVGLSEARERFARLGSWAEEIIRNQLDRPHTPPAETTVPSSASNAPSSPTTMDLPTAVCPLCVSGYDVVGELGRGGMGIVYLVDDPLGHRQLAVKMMRPDKAADPHVRARFLREARAASAIEHDNVVPIYQVGEDGGTPFLVMPLLRGESLEDRLQREPLSPLCLVFKVGREIALGLAAAHEKKLVHRDVKPGNTWLEGDSTATSPGRFRRVKLLDFGLARVADGHDGASMTGSIVGTPGYMAPEQARGERVDGRADLFSLGAILYRMTTGRHAFSAPTLTAVLTAIATHTPPSPISLNAAIPPALSSLIDRLLEKDPAKRPASALAVVDELAEIERAISSSPHPLGEGPGVRASSSPHLKGLGAIRNRWLAAGAALAVVLAIVAFAMGPGLRPASQGRSAESASAADTGEAHAPALITPPAASAATLPAAASPIAPTAQLDPLRVVSIDLMHFAKTAEGDSPRGILGKESFAPRFEDKVQVEAKLSRPGYAYIIAFRPDGVAELCFPNDEVTAPPLTDAPRYPWKKDGGKAYGLSDGVGLWAFAVVASEKPLPAYKQWLAARKPDWHPGAAEAGPVWWYDGSAMETFLAGSGPKRSKGQDLEGPAATVLKLGGWLSQTPGAAVGVIGFGVSPAK